MKEYESVVSDDLLEKVLQSLAEGDSSFIVSEIRNCVNPDYSFRQFQKDACEYAKLASQSEDEFYQKDAEQYFLDNPQEVRNFFEWLAMKELEKTD